MATTYWAEATVNATGIAMWQDGLSAGQIDQLRSAEARGIISGLTTGQDVDIVAAFRNPF